MTFNLLFFVVRFIVVLDFYATWCDRSQLGFMWQDSPFLCWTKEDSIYAWMEWDDKTLHSCMKTFTFPFLKVDGATALQITLGLRPRVSLPKIPRVAFNLALGHRLKTLGTALGHRFTLLILPTLCNQICQEPFSCSCYSLISWSIAGGQFNSQRTWCCKTSSDLCQPVFPYPPRTKVSRPLSCSCYLLISNKKNPTYSVIIK